MANNVHLPPGPGSVFDTDTNCALNTCPTNRSIYGYRPSLAANALFIALFGLSLIIHIAQGIKWKTWWFSGCMVLGCICEMVGYGGRIMLWENPFSFNGFIMQIVCITIAPAFFTASIYLTLNLVIQYLSRKSARFSPKLYLWIFVPCDIVALVLQGTGGGMSASGNSNSARQTGVNISIAGLAFQVATLSIFIILTTDYFVRYIVRKGNAATRNRWTTGFKIFLAFLLLAIIVIFIRCAFRIAELKEGYNGATFQDEGLFIGLESVMVTLGAFALNVAHPRPVLRASREAKEAMDDERKV